MIRTYLSFVLFALTFGCVGTEVGNPQDKSDVTVEFSFVTQDPSALTLDNGVELDTVWLAVEEVGLREAERCDEAERYDDESPFAVELLTGIEIPDVPMFSLQATVFCRMEIELEPLEVTDPGTESAEIPDDIRDSSVFVTGRLEDETPFEIRIDAEDTIELEGPFEARGVARLLVAFELNTWLTAEQFEGLEADPDGVIRISEESETEVAEDIANAIIRSGRLVRDTNENGSFDSEDELLATSIDQ